MRQISPKKLIPSAVLVPLIKNQKDNFTLLLTERCASLSHHGGEISLPGGRVDAEDRSIEMAALRECSEEVGIAPEFVDICGRLPNHPAGYNYIVSPVVGVVRQGFSLQMQKDEVADIFEVPLSFFMNDQNRVICTKHSSQGRWKTNCFTWDGREIWGATAGIIVSLIETLKVHLQMRDVRVSAE